MLLSLESGDRRSILTVYCPGARPDFVTWYRFVLSSEPDMILPVPSKKPRLMYAESGSSAFL
jgi:hypothetical protein